MSLTLNEIRGQYLALEKTVALLDEKQAALKAWFSQSRPASLVFVGCGSSFSLSKGFCSIASLRTDIPAYALAGGDLWLNCEVYRRMLTRASSPSSARKARRWRRSPISRCACPGPLTRACARRAA